MEMVIGGVVAVFVVLMLILGTKPKPNKSGTTTDEFKPVSLPTIVQEAIQRRKLSDPHKEGSPFFMETGKLYPTYYLIDVPTADVIGYTVEEEILEARECPMDDVWLAWCLADACIYDREGNLIDRKVTVWSRYAADHAGVCTLCGCDATKVPEDQLDGMNCPNCGAAI